MAMAPRETQPIRAEWPKLPKSTTNTNEAMLKFDIVNYNSIWYRGLKVKLAHRASAHMLQNIKQPLIIVNFSWKLENWGV